MTEVMTALEGVAPVTRLAPSPLSETRASVCTSTKQKEEQVRRSPFLFWRAEAAFFLLSQALRWHTAGDRWRVCVPLCSVD